MADKFANSAFCIIFAFCQGRQRHSGIINLMSEMMSENPVNNQGFWSRAFHLYYDGFRSMTVGKTLWLIIGIKLFIFFIIIKLIFFPNFLNTKCDSEQEKTEYVRHRLTNEANAKTNDVQSLPCKEEEDASHPSNRQTNN